MNETLGRISNKCSKLDYSNINRFI